ncbi:sodium-dependent transporter [Stella sp.]|uniref:sodium-dependent transporter n=1 Tax=Stella sp. TaxID=2912054 RepID=UPI0035ADFB5D
MTEATAGQERWAGQAGFLLAAVGAAVGLGNIWRFAYIVGDNGGGAFILAYLAALLVVGLPLLMAELLVGREARDDAASAFRRLRPGAGAAATGWLGVTASVVILSYYAVITGWVARYMAGYLAGGDILAGAAPQAEFARFVAGPVEPILWQAAVLVGTAGIVSLGVARGIEAASRLLMPVFALIVVALAIYGLSLPGAGVALAFLFTPDWTAMAEPRTWIVAIGQAFFSIGLGMGVLVTYGSYLPRSVSIVRAAGSIIVGDTLIALVAGIMIFSPLFTFGLNPAHGPALAFVVLPEVFSGIAFGGVLGAAFFLLLLLAALTSAVALMEVPVAVLMTRFGRSRREASMLAAIGVFVLGLPSALGYGPLGDALRLPAPVLDLVDHLASEVLLPISGMAIALFVGWRWQAAGTHLTSAPGRFAWLWVLRLLVPSAIAVLMLAGLLGG